jgi:hypothetical protein
MPQMGTWLQSDTKTLANASAESEKEALRKTLRSLSKADANELQKQLLDLRTGLAKTRRRLVENTGGQNDESPSCVVSSTLPTRPRYLWYNIG